MTPFPRSLQDDHDHELLPPTFENHIEVADEVTEALEITPSTSPSSVASRLSMTTTEEHDGKAWEVSTETEPMLQHPHLQLSLIRSSCRGTSSPSSPSFIGSPETPLSRQDSQTGLERTDDDEESVGYFDMDDFNSSYWLKAVSNVPTLSLAAILTTGFAIMHPWMFVVGALTAVGTAHAVGVRYDWITGSPSTSETSPSTNLDIERRADEKLPPTELFCRSFSPGNTTNASVIPKDMWLLKYFPPLECTVISNQEFPGLSASEFFQVFFADDAPYNFKEFQKKRGDADICYGRWRDATISSFQPQALSLVSHAAPLEEDDQPSVESFYQRVLTFKTLTKSYFGPPFAIATKNQVAVQHSKRCVVIESKTTLSQIPFCDRFYILERWLIQSEKKGRPSRHVANLQVHAEVVVTAKCPFESQIRSKSAATIAEVCIAWCAMAQEALKLTEQAKQERIQRQEQDEEEVSCCTSVSSYGKDEGQMSSSLFHLQGDNYSNEQESSIEVPYSNVKCDDDCLLEASNTAKRFSLGVTSPRVLLMRWREGRRLGSRRRAQFRPQ